MSYDVRCACVQTGPNCGSAQSLPRGRNKALRLSLTLANPFPPSSCGVIMPIINATERVTAVYSPLANRRYSPSFQSYRVIVTYVKPPAPEQLRNQGPENGRRRESRGASAESRIQGGSHGYPWGRR